MRIAAVGTALPPNGYDQATLLAALQRVWSENPAELRRLAAFFRTVKVEHRYLAQPIPSYLSPRSFGATNDVWIRVGQELGELAIRQALDRAGLGPRDVDMLFVVSVTGIASPSLDAMLIERMGMRLDTKRVPIFGLGCVAGASGLARAADYVKGFPDQVAVLLAVELCSLTLQRDDLSTANLISTGLFGDGAAAVVVVGERHQASGPRVVATRSSFYPGTGHVMGWRVSEKGFGLVLSPEVPEMAERHLGRDVDRFLADHGLTRSSIARWICHPGGPKVLEAVQSALGLDASACALSWRMLAEQGNLSSASVLMVLEATLRENPAQNGTHGVLLAMGPGFCAEMVLLQW